MRMAFTSTKKAKQKKVDRDIDSVMQRAKAQTDLPLKALYELATITVEKVLVLNANSDQYTADDFDVCDE